MNTPIVDFVKQYNKRNKSRLHMPGHKGVDFLGFEHLDITEITGADELFCCDGIIKQSQDNASSIFNTYKTLYSTEGSTQCIKAMLLLAVKNANYNCKRPYILAARNAHKAFIHACALLDIDVKWIYPTDSFNLSTCDVNAHIIESEILNNDKPIAVFLTSPDYLGNILDIENIAQVTKKYNVPLLVDNAHGAYLKFLNMHPIQLGADIVCDSAHKTLPAITGSAYLHIANTANNVFKDEAQKCLEVFSSSSPSYLILQSLDNCNKILSTTFEKDLFNTINKVCELKQNLVDIGCNVAKSEKLKLVLTAYENGKEIARILQDNNVEYEYADSSNVVLMFSPYNTQLDFDRIYSAFKNEKFPKDKTLVKEKFIIAKQVLTFKEAFLSKSEVIDIDNSLGKICAAASVSCPPAIPIVIFGEEITKEHITLLKRYNINKINVVKN